MCIVVDTNTFASVFDQTSDNHKDFAPVLNWLIHGEGKLIFGGTKYKDELKATKYLKIFAQLSKKRKIIEIDEEQVNKYQSILEGMESHKDFDDPHLVSICYISKCQIICTLDKRAYPFLSRKDFYPNNSPRPKIYSCKKNIDLLCRKYFAEICHPCIKLNKKDADLIK